MPRAKPTTAAIGTSHIGRGTSTEKVNCANCGKECKVKGLASHMRKCKRDQEEAEELAQRNAKRPMESPLANTPKRGRHSRQPDPEFNVPTAPLFGASAGPSSASEDVFGMIISHTDVPTPHANDCFPDGEAQQSGSSPGPRATEPGSPLAPNSDSPRRPQVDDIKVEYHNATGLPTKIYAFEDFKRDSDAPETNADPSSKPWVPFVSRTDFEFAELAHEAHLNKKQVTRLLAIIKTISSQKDAFTFTTSDDVDRAWEKAKLRHPLFSATKFSVDYQGVPQEFTLHSRSLWEWILQQVKDPLLAKHFHWDAQRLSKFDGETWVRFYDEPWTALKFARVQAEISKLNPRAKPLAIIIWADTSKLSTFGSQKGHFIVARIGNLPGHIRNGSYIGGGRIVGFVPIVEEDPKERKKPGFVNFKNAVYHEAFRIFLAQVAKLSSLGYEVQCGDGECRSLFPYIHIISADYEEHCRFALNRGLRGFSPCPVCHIPAGELANLRAKYPLRVAAEAKAIVDSVGPAATKDPLLKEMGMRDIRNALWDIANTDVHEAVSFDRLHAYIIGLWKHHLFEELKKILNALGRAEQARFEAIIDSIPRWSKLAHFKSVLNLDFGDGNKWESIAKIIMHAAYQVLTPQRSHKGFALLRALRKWIELNMLVSLEVQTDKTLAAYEKTLPQFGDYLDASIPSFLYRQACESDGDEKIKDWNGIVKVHSQIHAARDIRLKGVASNMDTKPNEKLNGAMRDAYHLQTNFKDVEGQLGRLEDRSMVSATIRSHVDALDEYERERKGEDPEEEVLESDDSLVVHIQLKARRPPSSIASVIADGGDDPAFTDFTKKFANRIRDLIIQEHFAVREAAGDLNLDLPVLPTVKDTDMITESRYVVVNYESKVTWKMVTDRLRCSPSFYGAPRYDCVITNWGNAGETIICRLIRVFSYQFNSQDYGFALVQPMNAEVPRRPGDDVLGLCRVKEVERSKSIFIPIRSVIRGAVLVEDKTYQGEYTVMDSLDGDMFLRLMDVFPNREMAMDI